LAPNFADKGRNSHGNQIGQRLMNRHKPSSAEEIDKSHLRRLNVMVSTVTLRDLRRTQDFALPESGRGIECADDF
jgi:hypothetical protein